MTSRTKLSLFSGAALLALAMATPASAAPAGSYQQTCRDIQQQNGRSLSAECQTRDGSWTRTRLDRTDCSGDIANIDGRLVCNENGDDRSTRNDRGNDDRHGYDDANRDSGNDRQYDHGDRGHDRDAYDDTPSYGDSYGERRFDDRGNGYNLSRWQMTRRMERQGYMNVRDLRPISRDHDWRAIASWRGHRVVVRVNPHNGRVLAARYI